MNDQTKKAGVSASHTNSKTDDSATIIVPIDRALLVEKMEQALRLGLFHSLTYLNTIETDIVGLVRKTVSDTLRTGSGTDNELIKVVQHVVLGAIEASEEAGNGLSASVKSVAKGIIMGVDDVGADVEAASAETIRSVITHAATSGTDIGGVTKNTVRGVLEAIVETGGNLDTARKNAVACAVAEAGKLSERYLKLVTDASSSILSSAQGEGELPRDMTTRPQATVRKPSSASVITAH